MHISKHSTFLMTVTLAVGGCSYEPQEATQIDELTRRTVKMPHLGTIPMMNPSTATMHDGLLYVSGHGGLQIVDASVPKTPAAVGSVPFGFQGAEDGSPMVVFDHTMYVVTAEGLVGIDVSNPADPKEIGGVLGETARDIAIQDDILYTAGPKGIRMYRILAPGVLHPVGQLDLPEGASAIDIDDRYAFVGSDGLRIVDVSHPEAPAEVGFVPMDLSVTHVAVSNGHAYVAGRTEGIFVFDVRLPVVPREVAHIGTPVYDVFVADGRIYVAAGRGGGVVYDVFNPAIPRLIGRFETDSKARGVFADHRAMYLVTDDALEIVGL